MVQVDIPAAIACGQFFAYLSKNYLKKEPNIFQGRLLGAFNFYMAVAFAPVGMFLMIGWPAWEVMYVTDWVENPYNKPIVAGFYVAFGVAMMVLANVGYLLAHKWYLNGKDQWVLSGLVISSIATVLPFIMDWGVWLTVGTYDEIKTNTGYSFWNAPFFNGWLFIMSYLVVSFSLATVWFKRKAKELSE